MWLQLSLLGLLARGLGPTSRSRTRTALCTADTSGFQGASDECQVGDELACAAVDEKKRLLEALKDVDRGFSGSSEQRKKVELLLQQMIHLSPAVSASGLGGDWELVYTNAPDILGLTGGPLAKLSRIGQQIDAIGGTIDNVIEYVPATWVSSAFANAADVTADRLQQRVLLTYETDGTRCNIQIRGTSLSAQQVLGVSLASAPPLRLQGPLELPFGSFEVLYNDGDLRIVKTQQGYWGVNRRLGPDESW